MRRIIECEKDTYITNKIINGTRRTDSNVGQAGTLDLFKLYNETYLSGVSPVVEQSYLLLKFNTDKIRALTSSIDINQMKCFLSLKNVYGGQNVPSNFNLQINPLGKSFQEGRGKDIYAFRDIDKANWLSASTSLSWSVTGANYSGSYNINTDLDYIISCSFGLTTITQSFSRGDEDLEIDISSLISGSIVGSLPDHGIKISFIDSIQNDQYTYFVKRFASRHSENYFKKPTLNLYFNDSIQDLSLGATFNKVIPVYCYNKYLNYSNENFISGSTQITGSNCLMLNLIASKTIYISTTSWSDSFSASITYTTSSISYLSYSFSGSQKLSSLGTNETGIYYANAYISSSDSTFLSFIDDKNEIEFKSYWKSLDNTLTYATGSNIIFRKNKNFGDSFDDSNIIANITNLKQVYTNDNPVKLRLFVQKQKTITPSRQYKELKSDIFENIYWRIKKAYSNDIVIDFDQTYNSNKLSIDGSGYSFIIYPNDLPINQVYEIEFKIIQNDFQEYIINKGFRFKVIE